MPIYAYRCAACGHAKDVLRKLSDAPLTICPACGAERFEKQVTAAGFQLKGSGWYVTDFRDGTKKEKAADNPAAPATEKAADSAPVDKAADTKSAVKADGATAPAAAASPAPAATAPPPASTSS
jgi:putative FmdB family regulatory protein